MDESTLVEMARSALCGSGSRDLNLEEVFALTDFLEARGVCIQSMEVMQVVSDTELPGRLDLGILGLDGPENWEEHRDVTRAIRLVRQKLALAKSEGGFFIYTVWLNGDFE